MREYIFDVKLFAQIDVMAESEADAHLTLKDILGRAILCYEAEPGKMVEFPFCDDGDPDLINDDEIETATEFYPLTIP